MFSRVVLPLDGAPVSEQAVPIAVALAQRWHAPLELIRVSVSPLAYETVVAFDTPLETREAAADLASLRAIAERLSAAYGIRVAAVQPVGEVASALVAFLEERSGAFVVMTSHGRGGISRLWLGSVTDRLIRRVRQPVLVIPAAHPPPTPAAEGSIFHRILVPLDGSELALAALDATDALMFSPDIELHFMRVLEPEPVLDPFPDLVATLEPGRIIEAASDRLRTATEDLERVARSRGHPASSVRTHAVIATSPAAAILEYAHENRVDLIALATHGRGGLERAVLGSVADKVLRGAETPVLVCRPA